MLALAILVFSYAAAILASTLAITPTTSDTVTIRGTTYSIIDVSTDPAQALWVVQARV